MKWEKIFKINDDVCKVNRKMEVSETEYITLNNGVKMPILGYGVYQVTKEEVPKKVRLQ